MYELLVDTNVIFHGDGGSYLIYCRFVNQNMVKRQYVPQVWCTMQVDLFPLLEGLCTYLLYM